MESNARVKIIIVINVSIKFCMIRVNQDCKHECFRRVSMTKLLVNRPGQALATHKHCFVLFTDSKVFLLFLSVFHPFP